MATSILVFVVFLSFQDHVTNAQPNNIIGSIGCGDEVEQTLSAGSRRAYTFTIATSPSRTITFNTCTSENSVDSRLWYWYNDGSWNSPVCQDGSTDGGGLCTHCGNENEQWILTLTPGNYYAEIAAWFQTSGTIRLQMNCNPIPTPDPTTNMPTTNAPTTNIPTTVMPSKAPTIYPTTSLPTTLIPTTNMPTSSPKTNTPTTVYPTTTLPTTLMPSTTVPTTLNPTTDAPTTLFPTTANPSYISTSVGTIENSVTNTMFQPSLNVAMPTMSPTYDENAVVETTHIDSSEEHLIGDKANVFDGKMWLIFVAVGCVILIIFAIVMKRFLRKKKQLNKKRENMENAENTNQQFDFVLHQSPETTMQTNTNGGMSDLQLTSFNTPQIQQTVPNVFDDNDEMDDIDGLYTVQVNENEQTPGNNLTKGSTQGNDIDERNNEMNEGLYGDTQR